MHGEFAFYRKPFIAHRTLEGFLTRVPADVLSEVGRVVESAK